MVAGSCGEGHVTARVAYIMQNAIRGSDVDFL